MYLTDYREQTLKDVITQLEPGLFQKVTGLGVKDFELLVSLGLFNGTLMNDAIYKFKRYEDASLSYTGVNRHAGENVGLYDTVISRYDYLAAMQQASMAAPAPEEPAPEPEHAPVSVPERVSMPAPVRLPKKAPPVTPGAEEPCVSVGGSVRHAKFGDGVVEEIRNGYIRVSFAQGTKDFQYPDAFARGFLRVPGEKTPG